MRNLDVRQLECFVAVADELHFARAAERMGVDTAVVSRQIRALEQRMGVKLLARSTRYTRLTGAGVVMLEKAKRMLEGVEEMREAVRAVHSE